MVELEAFAGDCRVRGRIEIGDRRMTDTLNATAELVIQDARLESLDDGRVVEMPELSIDRDELYAVVAAGSRGDPGRRVRTHARRVGIEIGPYHVEGAVHGTPASDPLESALRRAPWVPLTEVTVRYERGGQAASEEIATLVVNRGFASSFQLIEEPSVLLPWETPRASSSPASRSLDLTATISEGWDGVIGEAAPPLVPTLAPAPAAEPPV